MIKYKINAMSLSRNSDGSVLIPVMLITLLITTIGVGCFRESLLVVKMNGYRASALGAAHHARSSVDCVIKASSSIEPVKLRMVVTSGVESSSHSCGATFSANHSFKLQYATLKVLTHYCGGFTRLGSLEAGHEEYYDQYISRSQVLSDKGKLLSEYERIWFRQFDAADKSMTDAPMMDTTLGCPTK